MLSASVACGEVLDLAGCGVGYERDPLDAKPAIRRPIVNHLEVPADFKLFVPAARIGSDALLILSSALILRVGGISHGVNAGSNPAADAN